MAEVNVDALNVRTGPSTAYQVLAVVLRGERLAIIGRNDPSQPLWLQICCVNGRTGWISGPFTIISGDISQVPVVTP